MSFVRPEALRALSRWREALAGAAAAALGAFWMVTETGAALIIGTVLALGGALLIFAGIQRARFRRGDGGPGLVQVDEALLTYFGPYEGGSVAIADLSALHLDPGQPEGMCWILTPDGGEPLRIPVNAEGADALFDVFAGLPGINTEHMLTLIHANATTRKTVWTKTRGARALTSR
ncbi:MAG: hypothetical protein AAFR35_00260 [Pseudomonadota bacterium]